MIILSKVFSVDFIREWQTLIGSFLGPFLAIILSAFGFLIKKRYERRKEVKESIRRAEIGLSQSLSHIFISINQLQDFISRSKLIINELKKVPDGYAIHETNFPAVINIYFDEELTKMRFRSYYLHNKILINEYIVRFANGTILQFKEDFEKLLRKNEILMGVKANPATQRDSYIKNYEGFIKMIEKFLLGLEGDNIKSFAESKVYNIMLMESGFRTRWKYERKGLKFFKSKKDLKKYSESLEVLDRVNNSIKEKVVVLIKDAKERNTRSDESILQE